MAAVFRAGHIVREGRSSQRGGIVEVFLGGIRRRVGQNISTRVWSLPPQMLGNFWFNCSQGSILPPILGFEVCQGKAILKSAGNLRESTRGLLGNNVDRAAHFGNLGPSKHLFSNVGGSMRWILSSHSGQYKVHGKNSFGQCIFQMESRAPNA